MSNEWLKTGILVGSRLQRNRPYAHFSKQEDSKTASHFTGTMKTVNKILLSSPRYNQKRASLLKENYFPFFSTLRLALLLIIYPQQVLQVTTASGFQSSRSQLIIRIKIPCLYNCVAVAVSRLLLSNHNHLQNVV